jgi:hypothetical protein
VTCFCRFLWAVIVVVSAGCSPSPRTLSFLPDADDIQQIDIQDVVRGPEAAATLFPIEARYVLRSQTDAFVGRATFSVGSKQRQRAEADVRVPFDALDQFLRRLSSALLRQDYAPPQPPPGGAFPDVRVSITPRAAAPVILFTRSPGPQYLPWGVEVDGRTYTIESTAPGQAFAELRTYLKREELDRLTQAAVGAVQ